MSTYKVIHSSHKNNIKSVLLDNTSMINSLRLDELSSFGEEHIKTMNNASDCMVLFLEVERTVDHYELIMLRLEHSQLLNKLCSKIKDYAESRKCDVSYDEVLFELGIYAEEAAYEYFSLTYQRTITEIKKVFGVK